MDNEITKMKIKLQDLPEYLQYLLKYIDDDKNISDSIYKPDILTEDNEKWQDEGNYSIKSVIFKYNNKHYRATYTEQGNLTSGYYIKLDSEEFNEVSLKTKTIQYYE